MNDAELPAALASVGDAIANLVTSLRGQVASLEDRLMRLEAELRAPRPPAPPAPSADIIGGFH